MSMISCTLLCFSAMMTTICLMKAPQQLSSTRSWSLRRDISSTCISFPSLTNKCNVLFPTHLDPDQLDVPPADRKKGLTPLQQTRPQLSYLHTQYSFFTWYLIQTYPKWLEHHPCWFQVWMQRCVCWYVEFGHHTTRGILHLFYRNVGGLVENNVLFHSQLDLCAALFQTDSQCYWEAILKLALHKKVFLDNLQNVD